jgi:hypothetical protein
MGTTTSTNTNTAFQPNPQAEQAYSNFLQNTQNLAFGAKFNPGTIATVAHQDPQTLQAEQLAQNSLGNFQPMLDVSNALAIGASNPAYNTVGNYLNPFTNDVAQSALALSNENFAEQLNAMHGNPQLVNAGGNQNSRMGVMDAQAQFYNTLANQNMLSNLYSGGFNTALGAAQAQQGLMGQEAFTAANNAGLQSNLTANNINQLYQAGQTQQNQAQLLANYNAAVQQGAAAFPFKVNQYGAGLASVLGPQMSSTQGSTSSTSGGISPVIGGLLTLGGLFANRGGRIEREDGGRVHRDSGGEITPYNDQGNDNDLGGFSMGDILASRLLAQSARGASAAPTTATQPNTLGNQLFSTGLSSLSRNLGGGGGGLAGGGGAAGVGDILSLRTGGLANERWVDPHLEKLTKGLAQATDHLHRHRQMREHRDVGGMTGDPNIDQSTGLPIYRAPMQQGNFGGFGGLPPYMRPNSSQIAARMADQYPMAGPQVAPVAPAAAADVIPEIEGQRSVNPLDLRNRIIPHQQPVQQPNAQMPHIPQQNQQTGQQTADTGDVGEETFTDPLSGLEMAPPAAPQDEPSALAQAFGATPAQAEEAPQQEEAPAAAPESTPEGTSQAPSLEAATPEESAALSPGVPSGQPSQPPADGFEGLGNSLRDLGTQMQAQANYAPRGNILTPDTTPPGYGNSSAPPMEAPGGMFSGIGRSPLSQALLTAGAAAFMSNPKYAGIGMALQGFIGAKSRADAMMQQAQKHQKAMDLAERKFQAQQDQQQWNRQMAERRMKVFEQQAGQGRERLIGINPEGYGIMVGGPQGEHLTQNKMGPKPGAAKAPDYSGELAKEMDSLRKAHAADDKGAWSEDRIRQEAMNNFRFRHPDLFPQTPTAPGMPPPRPPNLSNQSRYSGQADQWMEPSGDIYDRQGKFIKKGPPPPWAAQQQQGAAPATPAPAPGLDIKGKPLSEQMGMGLKQLGQGVQQYLPEPNPNIP